MRADRGRGPQRRGGGEAEDGVAGLVYRARAKEADAGDDLRGDTRGVVVEGAADEGCPFAVDGGLRGHRDAEQGPARLGEEARAEGDEHVRPEPRAAHGGGREGFAREEVTHGISKLALYPRGAPEDRRDAHLDAEGAGRLAEDLAHEDIAAAPVGAVGPARVGHRSLSCVCARLWEVAHSKIWPRPGSPRNRVCISSRSRGFTSKRRVLGCVAMAPEMSDVELAKSSKGEISSPRPFFVVRFRRSRPR